MTGRATRPVGVAGVVVVAAVVVGGGGGGRGAPSKSSAENFCRDDKNREGWKTGGDGARAGGRYRGESQLPGLEHLPSHPGRRAFRHSPPPPAARRTRPRCSPSGKHSKRERVFFSCLKPCPQELVRVPIRGGPWGDGRTGQWSHTPGAAPPSRPPPHARVPPRCTGNHCPDLPMLEVRWARRALCPSWWKKLGGGEKMRGGRRPPSSGGGCGGSFGPPNVPRTNRGPNAGGAARSTRVRGGDVVTTLS